MKRYVIDTSVLLHDSNALLSFEDNEIYLPPQVIGELDHKKKEPGRLGQNARAVSRFLKKITEDANIKEGINLENGGTLFLPHSDSLEDKIQNTPGISNAIESGIRKIVRILENRWGYADDYIISAAREIQNKDPDTQVAIVTKDTNLMIRARYFGLKAQDYLHNRAVLNLDDLFGINKGYLVSKALIDNLFSSREKRISTPSDLSELLVTNEYATLRGEGNSSALIRYTRGEIQLLRFPKKGAEDIRPVNSEQKFLMDACFDKDISVVYAIGQAGTGKTLVSLACALSQVLKGPESDEKYDKVIVFRPLQQAGDDIGFLPGELEAKIGPSFLPIKTALNKILGRDATEYIEKYQNIIEFRPINFEAGETHDNTFMIIDEAQEYTPEQIKLLGTRMGKGSKLVISGDPFQCKNPYLDEMSNGLTVAATAMYGKEESVAVVALDKVVRSEGSKLFAKYL